MENQNSLERGPFQSPAISRSKIMKSSNFTEEMRVFSN